MIPPRLIVVGHCTSDTARVFCCADGGTAGKRIARLAWRAGGRMGFVDRALTPARPYELGVFQRLGLPEGAAVTYGIVIGENASSLPAADEILQNARVHIF